MAINLASKYEDKILQEFTHASFMKNNVSNEYDFTGVKSLTIYTPVTVDLNDYDRTKTANRFGTPTEMEDTVQEMTMSQDKGFAITIDRGNNSDQMLIKESGKMLGLQVNEKVVPHMDKYAFKQFAVNAGTVKGITKPTKATIVSALMDAETALTNALVPAENRYLYIGASMYNLLRQSSEFLAVDTLANKALSKGVVGQIADMTVVKVPDSYLPDDCYFIVMYKKSGIMPVKIKTQRILKEVAGLDGALLEGRYYFDAFVLGTRAAGIYAAVSSSKVQADPTISAASSSTTITSSGAVEIKYTTDGTDPRYSKSAKVYSAAISGLAVGTVVKAVAYGSAFPSAVAEATVAN